MLPFTIEPTTNPTPADARDAALVDPGFGKLFTDHMVVVRYDEEKGGWYEAKVTARAPIPMDPASSVLHYAQEIFEGMKAYKLSDGSTALFRPDANARRFNQSATRMAMPHVPQNVFIESVEQLVRIDSQWFPNVEGGALYLRPFMFASEVFLGVRPAKQYLFITIASPVGAYFKSGMAPVTIWVSQHYTRAAPGGTGAAKCGGNYAASLVAQAEATGQGCDQVVFLDAAEHKWVEELGGMNLFFVFDDGSIITPPLTGTILPGITRSSIIDLARAQGLTVSEQPYSIDQWQADAQSGRLRETFACGTAAVVTPVGTVKSPQGSFTIGGNQSGPVTASLRSALVSVQRGDAADPHGWVHRIG